MAAQYRYNLQKGSSKNSCPECGRKTFVRYVDSVTGECSPPQYGRCDRESKCGHNNRPQSDKEYKPFDQAKEPPKPPQFTPIPFEVLADTLTKYEQNVFIQNLLQRVAFPFDPCDIEAVISQYYLGTVATFGGGLALPYIDIQNNIRAIQVKQFDQTNHTTKTSFLHSILKYQYSQRGDRLPDWLPAYELNETKVSCLFGEHLLNKYPLNPVALVEAPKSAIYGTLYFGLPSVPDRFLWLAVFNLSSLNVAKCKTLQGRDVVLFPDLSKDGKAFDLWNSKLNELNRIQGAKFTISDLLESEASPAEREKGCDIADYLICQDWRLFRESAKSVKSEDKTKLYFCPPQKTVEPINTEIEPPSVKSEKSESETKLIFCTPSLFERDYRPPTKENWSVEISELEKYFAAVELPSQPVRLNPSSIILNVPLFIESHLTTLKANNGRGLFFPHLNRLQILKQILSV